MLRLLNGSPPDRLVLTGDIAKNLDQRHPSAVVRYVECRSPLGGTTTSQGLSRDVARSVGAGDVEPMDLEAPTVVNGTGYFARLKANGNLPDYVKKRL